MWKDNGGKRQAPGPKPTVSMLFKKYTSSKNNNVFNRLGGNKRPRSPSGPAGHEQWQKNSYDQQPYFAIEPTYWGCAPPMYPQIPPWGFNPWAPYPIGPASYFQPGWIPPRPMFRPNMHEKRARFNHEARSRDAIMVRGKDGSCKGAEDSSSSKRFAQSRLPRHNADGKLHIGGQKFAWVPVRSKGDVKDSVEHDECRSGCATTNQPGLGAAHNVDNGKLKSAAGVAPDPETIMIGGFRFGSVQKRVPGSEKISNDALQL